MGVKIPNMKPNYSLDDMRCFCMVAQYGSFKQAAVALQMPLSTLSRRIAKLEQDLALRLFNRDAHRVQLTFAGQRYYRRSAPIFDELDNVAACLQQDRNEAKGTIRISAPINFSVQVLVHHFNAFMKQYPDIELDLKLSNQTIDIDEEAMDLAFRIGHHSATHWIGRQLTNIRFAICGPANLDVSHIKAPADLAGLPTVLCSPMLTWSLQHIHSGEKQAYTATDNIRLKVDDMSLLTEVIAGGIGVGFIPDYHAQPLLESGKIQHILPDWSNQARGCEMLYRDRDNIPYRVRLLIDFMLQRFQGNDGVM
ncbi:MAG: LysR family transcriptional regulator [Idiomarina sp.]|nr:LysR family transcriptional regulator [Idiomarina sp.]|tara:strand:+ start:14118 stop:15044 length:927 start_codon:yes stop_codon:yes gene_type:complete